MFKWVLLKGMAVWTRNGSNILQLLFCWISVALGLDILPHGHVHSHGNFNSTYLLFGNYSKMNALLWFLQVLSCRLWSKRSFKFYKSFLYRALRCQFSWWIRLTWFTQTSLPHPLEEFHPLWNTGNNHLEREYSIVNRSCTTCHYHLHQHSPYLSGVLGDQMQKVCCMATTTTAITIR